jgi:Eukaryotic aspartyl protease
MTPKANNSTRKSKKTHVRAAKDASSGAAAPKTLRIPITNVFDGSDYSAAIRIGSQGTPANVILDTGSSTLAVVPSVYQGANDTNMEPTTYAQQVLYGTGGWIGPIVNTSLSFGDTDGNEVTLPSAPIAITVSQAPNNFTGVDGIMGLAFASLNTAFDLKAYLTGKVNPPVTMPWPFPAGNFATASKHLNEITKSMKPVEIEPYFTELESQDLTANKFAFYTLRSWVRCASNNKSAIAADPWNQGIFILGGGDDGSEEGTLYTGNFLDVDVLHDVYYNVNLISVQVGNRPAVKAKPLQPQYAGAASNCIVDSGTSALVLSNDVFEAVLAALEKLNTKFIGTIRHAAQHGISSTMLNLAEWPTITFNVTGATGGSVALTCSPQTYWQEDFPSPGISQFQISAGGTSDPVNQSILGLPLMNNYYTVFDRSQGAGNGVVRFAAIKLP